MSKQSFNVLAIDYGASSGRVFIGRFDGRALFVEELCRFPNTSTQLVGGCYWDILYLFSKTVEAIEKSTTERCSFHSMGTDGWGLDFGLLDKAGRLIGQVHSYRDTRTLGIPERMEDVISKRELFNITGITPTHITTLYQLISLKENGDEGLDRADKLLFVPNLLSYFLTGTMSCDTTLASASMLFDIEAMNWSRNIRNAFSIPDIFPNIARHGDTIGHTDGKLFSKAQSIPVVCVPHHDTAASFSCAPRNAVCINCGTWAVVGAIIDKPKLTDSTFHNSLCNEVIYNDQFILAANLTGLFIIQECVREWVTEGFAINYEILDNEAQDLRFDSEIDISRVEFSQTNGMCGKISEYCRESGQKTPDETYEYYACIMNSLAKCYAETVRMMWNQASVSRDRIYIMGGGAKNKYLCNRLQDLLGVEVVKGPVESTAMGNIMAQLISAGKIKDVDEFFEIIT